MTHDSDFVVIGRIRRAHGTRGEVCVEPVTDFPQRFESLREVLIMAKGGQPRRAEIESVRWKGKIALVKLAGVDDRDVAAKLNGELLGVRRSEVVPTGEDEYYHFDLIGMKVVDTACNGTAPLNVGLFDHQDLQALFGRSHGRVETGRPASDHGNICFKFEEFSHIKSPLNP